MSYDLNFYFFYVIYDLNFYSITARFYRVRSWDLRNDSYARVLSRENISIDLPKDRDENSGSGARSGPSLSIESQSRDRSPRSTIQILGHRNSFSALLLRCLLRGSKEKKREDQDGERRELCCLLLNIQSCSIQRFFYSSSLPLFC